VQAIALDVGHVVEQVDRPGQAAEQREGQQGAQEGALLEKVLGQAEGPQQQEVLGPLVRAERNEEGERQGRRGRLLPRGRFGRQDGR
jgi:hypothetical protein